MSPGASPATQPDTTNDADAVEWVLDGYHAHYKVPDVPLSTRPDDEGDQTASQKVPNTPVSTSSDETVTTAIRPPHGNLVPLTPLHPPEQMGAWLLPDNDSINEQLPAVSARVSHHGLEEAISQSSNSSIPIDPGRSTDLLGIQTEDPFAPSDGRKPSDTPSTQSSSSFVSVGPALLPETAGNADVISGGMPLPAPDDPLDRPQLHQQSQSQQSGTLADLPLAREQLPTRPKESRATGKASVAIRELRHQSAPHVISGFSSVMEQGMRNHINTFKRVLNPKRFFTIGRVFVMLWIEPLVDVGSGSSSILSAASSIISTDSFGERISSKIRRFVVIREGSESCSVLPIMTYGGQGVAKLGVKKSEHAIIYTGRECPAPHAAELAQRGEAPMLDRAIRVDPDFPTDKLDPMSRLDFGKVHNIDHHIKLRSIGRVHRRSIEPLLLQFRSIMGSMDPTQARYQSSRLRTLQRGDTQYPRRSSPLGSSVDDEQDYSTPRVSPFSTTQRAAFRDVNASDDDDATEQPGSAAGSEGYGRDRKRDGKAMSDPESDGLTQEMLSGYQQQPSDWFKRYRVFTALWPTMLQPDDRSQRERNPNKASLHHKFSKIGWFVVVGTFESHSLCLSITTAIEPANSESKSADHTVALHDADQTTAASSLGIQREEQGATLDPWTRLDYSRFHTIEHYARVRAFGWVCTAQRGMFDGALDAACRLLTSHMRLEDTPTDKHDNSDAAVEETS